MFRVVKGMSKAPEGPSASWRHRGDNFVTVML